MDVDILSHVEDADHELMELEAPVASSALDTSYLNRDAEESTFFAVDSFAADDVGDIL